MSKILFVEDELSANIDALLILFDKYLEEPERKKLEEIRADPLNFGANNEEIKAIFKPNPCIDVEYSFPGALKAISEKCDDYLLFIVDRNLSEAPSDLADIQAIDPSFTEDAYTRYMDREGDYLLAWLARKDKGINCCDSFYFMTANGPEQSLKNEEIIDTFINMNVFKKSNFIGKGNYGEDFVRFRDKIINDPDIKLIKEYSDVFEVFEKGWIDNKYRKVLIAAIKDMKNWQKPNIKDNAGRIRRIFESLYVSLALKTELIPEKYNSEKTNEKIYLIYREILQIREIIKYFEKEKEISPDQADTATFIWSMTSEIIHEGVNKTLPTQYTNRALVYGLCDAILWFKSKMIEHGCK